MFVIEPNLFDVSETKFQIFETHQCKLHQVK